jgi:membrane protein DedA with SNARE-associated domain
LPICPFIDIVFASSARLDGQSVRGGAGWEREKLRLIHSIEGTLLDFIRSVYDTISWPGVVVLMAIESACIPLPSELIMPLAGWMLIKANGLGFEYVFLAAFCGALGNTIGSIIAYYAGSIGGRPMVLKYGRYVLISHHDLDLADRFFARWGMWAVFFARVLPIVRTFVSLPAGISKMDLGRFIAFTFAGSFIWSFALASAGYALGENWEDLRTWMRPADYPIALILAVLLAWYVVRHVRRAWEEPQPSGPEA